MRTWLGTAAHISPTLAGGTRVAGGTQAEEGSPVLRSPVNSIRTPRESSEWLQEPRLTALEDEGGRGAGDDRQVVQLGRRGDDDTSAKRQSSRMSRLKRKMIYF